MRFRKLRIACSVACALACVLLIASWVRSYWVQYRLMYPTTGQAVIEVDSAAGIVWVQEYDVFPGVKWNRALYQFKLDGQFLAVVNEVRQKTFLGFARFGTNSVISERTTVVPYWFLVLVSASLVYAPWLPWSSRFGLRTLLIATTLVAVILGAIVYAVR
jgi:hypothetical protein